MTDEMMAEYAQNLEGQGRIEEARRAFEFLVESTSRRGSTLQHAWALKSLSVVERRQGNLELALEHIEASLVVAVAAGDRSLIAELKGTRGNIRSEIGDYTGAIADLHESLRGLQEAGRHVDALQVLNNLGVSLARSGLVVDATQAFEKVLTLADQLGEERIAAQAHNNLGCLYMDTGSLASAEQHFVADSLFCLRTGDKYGEGVAEANLAEVDFSANLFDKARRRLLRAEELFEGLDAKRELLQVRRRLSELPVED